MAAALAADVTLDQLDSGADTADLSQSCLARRLLSGK
jgi:hypothetical protein